MFHGGIFLLMASYCISGLCAREISIAEQQTNTRAGSRQAESQNVQIGKQIFHFGVDFEEYILFSDAEVRCEDLNMTLVSIQTKQKNDMIFSWIEQNPDFDLYFWTSGYRAANSSQWTWRGSGEDFTDTTWLEGEPSRGLELESCVNFAAWKGGWEDDDCETKMSAFLCEGDEVQGGTAARVVLMGWTSLALVMVLTLL